MTMGKCFILFMLCLIFKSFALQPGDRITTLVQTLHSDMKTQWSDIALNQMPRFGKPDSVIIHTNLPKYKENSTDYKIDPTKDVKVSLSFAGNKLLIPWIPIYDSKNRRVMRKLVVTFTIDEFEVIRVQHTAVFGARISHVDPSHPSLRGFEIEYRWQSVQEEDFGLGVVVLFSSAILGFFVIFLVVVCNSELGETVSSVANNNQYTNSGSGKYNR